MATNHSPPPDVALADVLDIAAFQNLTDSFYRLTGIATAILDTEGKILIASGWQPICTEFHRKNQFTAQKCLESDTALANQLAQGKKYNVYQCKNGLVDVAAPIILDNHHVGNIFAGQFFFAPPDIDFFLRQAEQFGFAKEEYLEMLSHVPVIAEEKMRQVMSFLTDLTILLGNSAIDKKELLHLNKNLEQLVQARTIELKEELAIRKKAEQEKEDLIASLQESLKKVKQLSGFLPICASCKKIRDDEGYWNQIEWYIREHSEVKFSHGMCPDCAKKLYPDMKFSEE